MIFEDLKKANMQAMKDHDQVAHAILPVVINKIQMFALDKKAKGEALTDGDSLQVINKAIKELDEEILAFEKANRAETVATLKAQREILSKYLPKMLSEDEIRTLISKMEDKTIPSVMKFFKTNYQGMVDMKLVSQIAKEF